MVIVVGSLFLESPAGTTAQRTEWFIMIALARHDGGGTVFAVNEQAGPFRVWHVTTAKAVSLFPAFRFRHHIKKGSCFPVRSPESGPLRVTRQEVKDIISFGAGFVNRFSCFKNIGSKLDSNGNCIRDAGRGDNPPASEGVGVDQFSGEGATVGGGYLEYAIWFF
jgi:hypothetical protein